MTFDHADFDKIIAIRFGMTIRFGDDAIQTLLEYQDYDQLISLAEFKFMHMCDFGEKWGNMQKIRRFCLF